MQDVLGLLLEFCEGGSTSYAAFIIISLSNIVSPFGDSFTCIRITRGDGLDRRGVAM